MTLIRVDQNMSHHFEVETVKDCNTVSLKSLSVCTFNEMKRRKMGADKEIGGFGHMFKETPQKQKPVVTIMAPLENIP